jgi:LacI family transcriptional regulator, gluconate utilization system Gnt-I transcriptional repressor
MTVARALREPEKVAPGTLERVRAVIDATGYTPDLTARGLASQRSGLVAAIVPLLTNSLIAEIVQGLTDALASRGLHLLLGVSGFDAKEEEALIRAFLSRRVDAFFLTGLGRSAESARMLRDSRLPVVEGGNLTDRPIDMVVGYSNVLAAMHVTQYLIGRGYSPIGYIGAHRRDNDRARDRRHGFESALRQSGRAPVDTLCIDTDLDVKAGARAMAKLLSSPKRPRAVFCSADAIAVGALFECQRRGVAVPHEVAIAGFDDVDLAGQVVPALTTIRVLRYELGRRAGTLIGQRLAEEPIESPVVDVGFEFVARDSA